MLGQGHRWEDLINKSVLFFPLYSYPIVYQPDVDPLRIMAVLRGDRDVKRVLKKRRAYPWRLMLWSNGSQQRRRATVP